METCKKSRHASARQAQRGITANTLNIILSFGSSERRGGAEVCFMDRQARLRAADAIGSKQFAQIERGLDAYLVVGGDGMVITCARRLRRLHF